MLQLEVSSLMWTTTHSFQSTGQGMPADTHLSLCVLSVPFYDTNLRSLRLSLQASKSLQKNGYLKNVGGCITLKPDTVIATLLSKHLLTIMNTDGTRRAQFIKIHTKFSHLSIPSIRCCMSFHWLIHAWCSTLALLHLLKKAINHVD